MSDREYRFRFLNAAGGRRADLYRLVEIDHARVADFACRRMTPAEVDLLTIAGCVHYADRAGRRKLSQGWARTFNLEIAVHDRGFWSRKEVKQALQDCLTFVTGDCWQFEFFDLRPSHPCLSENFLTRATSSSGNPAVVAYSGGLDSYAGLRLLQRNYPSWEPYLVRAGTHSMDGIVVEDLRLPSTARVPLLVRVRLPKSPGDREPTGRTRTFLFLLIAGVAASLLDARRIVVCENGQGSIGPSLIHGPWEFPFRATHPGFMQRLGRLLALASGKSIGIEHPFLGQTKGEVLSQLPAAEITHAVGITKSCARYPLRHKAVKPALPCGICGGCLLRRVSLVAAGHADLERAERHHWGNLSAATIAGSSTVGPTSKRDEGIAVRAVLDMSGLAALASRNGDVVSIRRVASELAAASNLSIEDALSRLKTLLHRHAEDWAQFVATLSDESWVHPLCGAKHA